MKLETARRQTSDCREIYWIAASPALLWEPRRFGDEISHIPDDSSERSTNFRNGHYEANFWIRTCPGLTVVSGASSNFPHAERVLRQGTRIKLIEAQVRPLADCRHLQTKLADSVPEWRESCTKKRTKPLQPMIYEILIKRGWFCLLSRQGRR